MINTEEYEDQRISEIDPSTSISHNGKYLMVFGYSDDKKLIWRKLSILLLINIVSFSVGLSSIMNYEFIKGLELTDYYDCINGGNITRVCTGCVEERQLCNVKYLTGPNCCNLNSDNQCKYIFTRYTFILIYRWSLIIVSILISIQIIYVIIRLSYIDTWTPVIDNIKSIIQNAQIVLIINISLLFLYVFLNSCQFENELPMAIVQVAYGLIRTIIIGLAIYLKYTNKYMLLLL